MSKLLDTGTVVNCQHVVPFKASINLHAFNARCVDVERVIKCETKENLYNLQ